MSDPNSYQVGGSHYKSSLQHWDFIEDEGLGYLEGYASKYLVRWRKTGTPIKDLKKSRHAVEKLLEKHKKIGRRNRSTTINSGKVEYFCNVNDVTDLIDRRTLICLFIWSEQKDLERVIEMISVMIDGAEKTIEAHRSRGRTEHPRPFGYVHEEEEGR